MAGLGSSPGERRGGREAGTPNKATIDRKQAVERAVKGGETPLEIICKVMRGDKAITDRQFAAATAAAPYVHARLSAAVVANKDILSDLSDEQLSTLLAAAERLIAAGLGGQTESRDDATDRGEQTSHLLPLH